MGTQLVTKVSTKVGGPKMTRKDADKRTFPKISPMKGATMYTESKKTNRAVLPPLQWDIAPNTHKKFYFEAKHNLKAVNDDVQNLRRDTAYTSAHFKKKWRDVEKLAKCFRNYVEFCNDFITKNAEKRRRFKEKLKNSKELMYRTERNTFEIIWDMEYLTNIKHSMEGKIKQYEMYQDFLDVVAKQDPLQFRNANDVIQRYEALQQARYKIIETHRHRENTLKKSVDDVRKLLDEQYVRHMNIVTQLENCTRYHQETQSATIKIENLITLIYREAFERRREYYVVKMTCWSLYKHMKRKRFTSVVVEEYDYPGQLKEISKVLGILKLSFSKLNLAK